MDSQQMKDWAYKNQKFLKLEPGETITAVLQDAKPVTSRFDPEKELMRYYLKLPDGIVKHFENGSTVLAEQMAQLLGKEIVLKREGEGQNTRYHVTTTDAQEAWDDNA